MKYWKNVKDVEVYTPPGHEGTFNRRLVSPSDAIENIEVIIGEMEPGGKAKPHFHEDIEQIMYILSGEMYVKIENKETVLSKGDVVIIPKKTIHEVKNVGLTHLRFILIYSPPKLDVNNS